jgi:site-specific DNA-methyltransferase (adenine-specific)
MPFTRQYVSNLLHEKREHQTCVNSEDTGTYDSPVRANPTSLLAQEISVQFCQLFGTIRESRTLERTRFMNHAVLKTGNIAQVPMHLGSPPTTIEGAYGASPYSEEWSLHPGEALRLKRGLSAKDQQARAKNPVVLSQDIFERPALSRKAFYADETCLIFCGEVREVLELLRESGVLVDTVITSPPFYGQRDYGVPGQIGLEQKPEDFIAKLTDVFCGTREVRQTTGSLWVNLGDTYWNGRGEHKGRDRKQRARRFGLRPQDRRGDGKLCKNKQLLLIPHRFAISMQDKDWIVRNDNVWLKPNPIPDQVADRSCMSHEYVFHFVTQRFYYYNRVAVGRKTTKGTYMPPPDTWKIPMSKGGTSHKASFSEELVRIPILATTPPNGIVLDPFAGSGTSLIFAKLNGFRSIGIDIKEEYCQIMRESVRSFLI